MAHETQSRVGETGRYNGAQRTGASGAPNQSVVQVSLLRDRTPRFEVRLTADLVWSIEREISATLSSQPESSRRAATS